MKRVPTWDTFGNECRSEKAHFTVCFFRLTNSLPQLNRADGYVLCVLSRAAGAPGYPKGMERPTPAQQMVLARPLATMHTQAQ